MSDAPRPADCCETVVASVDDLADAVKKKHGASGFTTATQRVQSWHQNPLCRAVLQGWCGVRCVLFGGRFD
jgi:hypothetical protein